MIEKIISGGQTGVDRAALDAAILYDIPHGGWSPRGRKSEDGVIPAKYNMVEDDSDKYPPRTRKNVADADATVILHFGKIGPGTRLTIRLTLELNKPHLIMDLSAFSFDEATDNIADFISKYRIINFAGPRESKNPGLQHTATQVIYTALLKVRT